MRMDFRDHLRKRVVKKNDRILEFGPLNWPIVRRDQFPNTYYADIRNSDEIKELYTSNDYLKSTGISIDRDSIVDIDYVIRDSYKKTFKKDEKFDAIILSHVIEHIPDIILFFNDVKNIIKENGKLIIIYPDARYCFDHFRNGTTFIDAYNTYKSKEINHNAVFDFVNNVVSENDPSFFWKDPKQNDILPQNEFKKSLHAFDAAKKGEMPDDMHFWPFADYQFIKFLYDMDRAGLLDFDINNFYETQEDTQEFMVVLKPKTGKRIKLNNYKNILSTISPSAKMIGALNQITKLQHDLKKLEVVNTNLQQELSEIYRSKKWRYGNKIANIKNRITK
jgi:SAM-dependent methyltransferase